jgi:hypothetical protein
MARRRDPDRPVEKLRSSWTSTADLEETLASMFHRETVPGDKLSPPGEPTEAPSDNEVNGLEPHPPDSLTSLEADKLADALPDILSGGVEDKLTGAPPDNLATPTPDKLTTVPGDKLAGPLYQTLDGMLVDAKCIRAFDAAQQGHTLSEHLVYTAMWRLLGSQNQEQESREGLLPMRLIAVKVSLSVRNLRRVLHTLVDKLAVDVTEFEDKTKSIPRRYRVWSPRAIVDRRRAAGYTHVYRNRNLITLAKPSVKLSPDT